MAIADLNADGHPDQVVTNHSNTVSVLLGNGDGTFAAKTDFGTGDDPQSVTVADLNGDGLADLTTANWGSNTVSVLLGIGDGTFAAKTDFGTWSRPYSVAIADLDGDGRADLAVAGDDFTDPGAVSVLLGIGDGTFRAKADFSIGSDLLSLALVDLNGDGWPDLVTAGSADISVRLGNGDGTFGTPTHYDAGVSPSSVEIADLNGDGRPDLAVPGGFPFRCPGTVSVLLGNGDGTFGTQADVGTGDYPCSVAIADLDGDSRPDLAVASESLNAVSVLLGNGDGTFGTQTDFGTGDRPCSVTIADLDGDSRPDLAVASEYSNAVSVLLGNGDGSFGEKTDFGTGNNPRSVATADLNGDGLLDLTTANWGSNTVSVLLGNGDGTFGTKTDFGTGSSPRSMAIADLNGDGRADLGVAGGSPGTVSVLLGNGDGTFGAKTDFPSGDYAVSVAIADLNGDGRPDLAVVGQRISMLLGNGDGTFGASTDVGTRDGNTSVAIADLNGDSRPDLAVANVFLNAVSVLLGNGDGAFAARIDFGAGEAPESVAIADLNGDSRLDLAVANREEHTVSILLNLGTPPAPFTMAFDFTPNVLNLASRGLWVTGLLEPPSPFAASDIDIPSILLVGVVPVDPAAPTTLGDHNGNGVPDLMVKFSRVAVELAVPEGDNIPVTVTGHLAGHPFVGTDHIRVRRALVSAPSAGSHLTAGSVIQVQWQTPGGVTVESVALLVSVDGGSTWSLVVHELPNTGSCDWTVPSIQTDQAQVAIVLVESADETGYIVEGLLGVSGMFAIESVVGVGYPRPAQFTLAMRSPTPNPSTGGRLWVEFSLGDGSPARLELMDVAGRVVTRRQLESIGPGAHALELSQDGALRPGIYFLRLEQGGKEVRARVAVVN